jgi:hypothetical protein
VQAAGSASRVARTEGGFPDPLELEPTGDRVTGHIDGVQAGGEVVDERASGAAVALRMSKPAAVIDSTLATPHKAAYASLPVRPEPRFRRPS